MAPKQLGKVLTNKYEDVAPVRLKEKHPKLFVKECLGRPAELPLLILSWSETKLILF